eukprot:2809832-Prymnesium_polylepis.1
MAIRLQGGGCVDEFAARCASCFGPASTAPKSSAAAYTGATATSPVASPVASGAVNHAESRAESREDKAAAEAKAAEAKATAEAKAAVEAKAHTTMPALREVKFLKATDDTKIGFIFHQSDDAFDKSFFNVEGSSVQPIVKKVDPGSLGEKAGLVPGDIVLS